MKRALFLICAFLLTACAKSPAAPAALTASESLPPAAVSAACGEIPAEPTAEKTDAPAQEEHIPQFPPPLTVVQGDTRVTALQGTSSWTYRTGEESCSICADAAHPLQAKDRMPSLVTAGEETVCLLWEFPPDEVTVRCYESAAWGTYDAQSVSLPVMTLQICSAREESPQFRLELQQGAYIYEIIAEWNSHELWGGSSCYSFYTQGN
jgi:hypothetical protein